MTDQQRKRFHDIRGVIVAYLGGQKVGASVKLAGLCYAELARRIARCVSYDAEGRMLGWFALLPHQRVAAYRRKSVGTARSPVTHGGYSGSLSALMRTHPRIEERLGKYLLTAQRDHSLPESRVHTKNAHQYFLSLCREYGLGENDWPFCVEHKGARSITNWVTAFYRHHYDSIVDRQYGAVAKVKAATGTGLRSRLQSKMPLDIVEMDEHTLDFFGSIAIPTPKGPRYVKVRRLTLILIVDRFSQAILAYTVIVRRKVNAADIIATVAKALDRAVARAKKLSGVTEERSGGLPSEVIAALAGCGFNMLLMDNDSAHLAEASLSRIGQMAGCAINYGKVAHFERRPVVESINRRLERSFQRLPSTTGSGPADPRRKDAEKKAVSLKIELHAVLDLIDAVIADHNVSLPAGNLGATPLEVLQHYVSDPSIGFLPPVLPPPLPGMPPLGLMTETVRVAGSMARGEKPHINFDRARYMAPWLSERMDLLGESVQLHIDEDDISHLYVIGPGGRGLGQVEVMGAWAGAPHSREMRRLINAAIDTGQMSRRSGRCIVSDWLARVSVIARCEGQKADGLDAAEAANHLAEAVRLGHVPAPGERLERTQVLSSESPTGPASSTNGLKVKTASDGAKERALEPLVSFFAIN
ncbi:hypothetical protein [Luteibacter sp. ME-Dv--P-043b]|uniref:hypothetical protein n=1 Tax=Luteibacter sp. ME-Dv--P-043b TaxID=3040291 RepID=UPI0025524F50|nr:hypothetical protein [Luteibacter sp. ME-Dv--P-043b]